jgi:hypothetical protein
MVDSCGGHAKAVQFYLVQPLRPIRWLLDRLGKLRREAGSGESVRLPPRREGPDLAVCEAERLTPRDMGWT